MGVYLSFSFRILTNAEALNAVESLGNIIRHRRATVVIPKGDKHVLLTVPAVSGEAIRHGYQLMLVKLASARGINVCKLCSIGEFVKHGIPDLIKELEPDLYNTFKGGKSLPEKELEIIKGCAVEDIAGFLVPMEELQIKRTSRVEVSYMLPALGEDSLAFSLDTQFHTRSAPQTQQILSQTNKGKKTSGEQSTSQSQEASSQEQPQAAQSIYYVESASAVYTFSVNIDLSGIGVASNCLYKKKRILLLIVTSLS
jgi:CRISPR-associated protein Csa2